MVLSSNKLRERQNSADPKIFRALGWPELRLYTLLRTPQSRHAMAGGFLPAIFLVGYVDSNPFLPESHTVSELEVCLEQSIASQYTRILE